MGGIGIFLVASALLIVIPVVLQVKQREIRWGETWGYGILIVGLLVAAAADTDVAGEYAFELAITGVVLALAGLLVQIRVQPRNDQP